MSEWQPIETAPKDGTIVVLIDQDELAVVGLWQGEWIADWDHQGFGDPTHWMPLPSAPVQS